MSREVYGAPHSLYYIYWLSGDLAGITSHLPISLLPFFVTLLLAWLDACRP